jgi:uncharacterized protein YbjT (DUF2867 family)
LLVLYAERGGEIMTKVLVTGGTGTLGREIVPRLLAGDYQVRVMSRRAQGASAKVEWAQANLSDGTGLAEAVQGVDAIIHAASSPMGSGVDVDGTQSLLRHAREAGVAHFVYISIVGIEQIEFSYYRSKLAAEQAIENSGVPWTILRAVQFHAFIDLILQQSFRFPVALVPRKWQFQSIDEGEAAQQLIAAMQGGPSGHLPEIGGPEILRLGDMARTWKAARGIRKPMVNMPFRIGPAKSVIKGLNLVPDNRVGNITWEEWLAKRYPATSRVNVQQKTDERPA